MRVSEKSKFGMYWVIHSSLVKANIQVFYRMFAQMYSMRLVNENGVMGAEMMASSSEGLIFDKTQLDDASRSAAKGILRYSLDHLRW